MTNPRALAGGIEETNLNGVLTPEHSFWVKTHLCLFRSFPPAKATAFALRLEGQKSTKRWSFSQ